MARTFGLLRRGHSIFTSLSSFYTKKSDDYFEQILKRILFAVFHIFGTYVPGFRYVRDFTMFTIFTFQTENQLTRVFVLFLQKQHFWFKITKPLSSLLFLNPRQLFENENQQTHENDENHDQIMKIKEI